MAFAQTKPGIAAGAHFSSKGELVRVLLISEARNGFSHLVKELEARRCQCRFVTSYDETLRLLSSEGFDLVVGVAPLPHGAISSLARSLAGAQASFFCVQPVEDGCWWVPIYRRGELCLGAPALRPSEFAGLLDEIVGEVRHVPAIPSRDAGRLLGNREGCGPSVAAGVLGQSPEAMGERSWKQGPPAA